MSTLSPDTIHEIAGQMIAEWQASDAAMGERVGSPAHHAAEAIEALRYEAAHDVLFMHMIYGHAAVQEAVNELCPDGTDGVDAANDLLASVVDAVIDSLAETARDL